MQNRLKKITDWILKQLTKPALIFLAAIITLFSLPPIAAQGLILASLFSFTFIEVFNIPKKYWWLPILIALHMGFNTNI